MIKAILLDYAGVVSNKGRTQTEFAKFINKSEDDIYNAFSKAKIDNAFNNDFIDFVGENAIKRFNLESLQKNKGLDEFLKNNKLPVYIGSNHISKILLDELEILGVKNKFKKIFISSDLECAKPDKIFFEKILNEINLKPSEVLFVDDQKKNLISPREMGLIDCWFTNTEFDHSKYDFKPTYTINSMEEVNKIIKNLNK